MNPFVYTQLIINKVKYRCMRGLRNSVRLLDANQTVQHVIDNSVSVCRYGDGELNMVLSYIDGYDESRKSGFQKYDSGLAKRLTEILEASDNKQCLICLPGCMLRIGTGYLRRYAAIFWETYTVTNLKKLLKVITSNRVYGETNFSRFYLSHRDKSRCAEFLRHVKKIWENRDIVIVEGEKTMLGIGNDLFDNARSVKRILCPPTNAWQKYPEILRSVRANVPLTNEMGGVSH